ncbi:MAG: MFS transporter [Sphaerochaetaceae bacterium]|nr:MFS transporter [Sphaerochaetaceae bacterium]
MSDTRKFSYSWVILVCCCLFLGATLGIITNCNGLYYLPVSQEFGIPMSSFTLASTISSIASCVGLVLAKKLILKYPLKVVLPIASLCVGVPPILNSFSHSITQWYILALVSGVGGASLGTYTVSVLISRWFNKKNGFAMGLATSSSGVVGMVMSLVIGRLINISSWRVALFSSGVLALVMTLPISLFLVSLDPKEKGTVAYGAEDGPLQTKGAAITSVPVRFDLRLVILLLGVLVISSLTSFATHLAALGKSSGITLVDASVVLTFYLVGNTIAKLFLGTLNDRIGIRNTTMLTVLLMVSSIVLMIAGSDVLLLVAAFLFGTVAMLSSTQYPLVVGYVWTKEEYASAMQMTNLGISLSYAVCTSMYGLLYDIFGSYKPVLWIVLGFGILEAVLLNVLIRLKRK